MPLSNISPKIGGCFSRVAHDNLSLVFRIQEALPTGDIFLDVFRIPNARERSHLLSCKVAGNTWQLDLPTGELRFSNAGHNLPILRTATETVEVKATGMPLGR